MDNNQTSNEVKEELIYDPSDELLSQRDAYADKLAEMGEKFPSMVVLDADLCTVGKTFVFRDKYPGRHIQVGIAEQNMMGIAAGLAQLGKIPIAHSLAVFAAGRPFDQIRESICYSKLNVKIVGLHAGVTLAPDGATHQTMEDIALMCSLPNMCVISPADAQQTRDLLPQLIELDSSVYFRLVFPKIPKTIAPGTTKLGKIQVLRSGTDITLVSTGQMVYKTLQAAEILQNKGISAEVLNVHTIKPIDKQALVQSFSKTKKGVVIEEHNIYGGLGSIVATVLAEQCPSQLEFINTNDQFGTTGQPEELLTKFGLQPEPIADKVINFCNQITPNTNHMNNQNEQKVAFITGASRGIGFETAKQFLKDGYTVVGGYLQNRELIENLKEFGNIIPLQFDQENEDSIKNAVSQLRTQFSHIHVLVNNAGINIPNDFNKITLQDWDKIFNVNLRGVFLLSKELENVITDAGSIINIASFSGQVGGPRTTHYAASKAGVISLTQNMARFFASRKIRVNCVSPGIVESEMAKAAGRLPILDDILLDRLGKPEEVANVVSFLASDKASYITGQTLNVNGGLYF
ncbi:SDR family oxidoreductase [Candidatus Kuenenbacteria bacterium]|nr:SDR family oxidoreductase [Candidatus Kuenenbacteria bacterium]